MALGDEQGEPETPDNSAITGVPTVKGNTGLGMNDSKIIQSTVSGRAVHLEAEKVAVVRK